MPWTEEDKQRMAENGEKAAADLNTLFKNATLEQVELLRQVAKWWRKWAGPAGHKNLYRAFYTLFGE